MKMSASWLCIGMMAAVAVIMSLAVASEESDFERALLSRMDAIEERVASLSDEIASLDSRLTKIDGGKKPVPREFRVVNLTRRHDVQRSTMSYTLLYEAEELPQILMAYNEGAPPMEVAHASGTVQFSVPDTELSPVVYVRTSSNLIYTLILLQASGGPPPESPEEFPSVVLTTTPERSLPFEENEEPAVTIISHVTGNREVRVEALLYYAYILKDSIVDFAEPSQLYEEDVAAPAADSDDVMGDANAGNGDGESTPQRLHLMSHNRKARNTEDKVKLATRFENSGVLYIQKRFEFGCQSCILYEVRVTKPLPYFLDNDLYTLPEGALVAYKDLYNFGPDFKGPRYFRFVRYNQSEAAHSRERTCYEGHRCELICEAFGDNPTVYFQLFGRSLRGQPAYFDQSGAQVSGDDAPQSAPIKGWSVRFGYVGFSVIRFDDVRTEHAGMYDCFADIESGLSLRRFYSLRVL